MAACRLVYDSRHLQADCQEPGSVTLKMHDLKMTDNENYGSGNARVENDGQKLRGLENAGLENDGQTFSKL